MSCSSLGCILCVDHLFVVLFFAPASLSWGGSGELPTPGAAAPLLAATRAVAGCLRVRKEGGARALSRFSTFLLSVPSSPAWWRPWQRRLRLWRSYPPVTSRDLHHAPLDLPPWGPGGSRCSGDGGACVPAVLATWFGAR
jgi:hypothetical protein